MRVVIHNTRRNSQKPPQSSVVTSFVLVARGPVLGGENLGGLGFSSGEPVICHSRPRRARYPVSCVWDAMGEPSRLVSALVCFYAHPPGCLSKTNLTFVLNALAG